MAKEKKSKELVKNTEERPVSLFEEMDDYFNNFLRHPFSMMASPLFKAGTGTGFDLSAPSVDIFEEGNDLVVKAELPGIEKKDLNVTVSGNIMTISGEKKQEEKVEKKNYHKIERSYGSFRRSLQLPVEVDDSKAKASFTKGVLEIRLPKTAKAKQKKIAVK